MATNEKKRLVFLEMHPVFNLKKFQEYYSPSGSDREVYIYFYTIKEWDE